MAKYYKLPFLARVANLIAHLLPERVHALIWIAAYDRLDLDMKDVVQLDDEWEYIDGVYPKYSGKIAVSTKSLTHTSTISDIRLENIRRKLWLEKVKAKVAEY